MSVLIAIMLTLVGLGGTFVAFTQKPEHLALAMSAFGISLSLLFLLLQAPDVALSQIGVGTAIVPLMVMLAIRKVERKR